jgi:hypothetical protein
MRQDSVGANAQVSEEGTHITGRQPSRPNRNMPASCPFTGLWLSKDVPHRDGQAEGRPAQFTVAPPQHFLYFFPEPHGHGSFRPTLGALRRGSIVWALGLTGRCSRK